MTDMDMDMDGLLDGPAQQPARPSRFAPKGSKFKPKPKTESSHSLPPPASGSHELLLKESNSIIFPKTEDLSTQPNVKSEYTSAAIKMDVEVKPDAKAENEIKEEGKDDVMDRDATESEFEVEDVVVREIDVYFTPNVDPNTRLYVLQYPLRPLWRPYEFDERCEVVRVKPASAEVEVELSVDVDSKNYDADTDPRVQMKKQVLTSCWKPPHTSGYAVGVLSGNKLHLNPVHAVVQLRPSMQHLDVMESKRKGGMSSSSEDVIKAEVPQEGKSTGAPKKQNKPPTLNKDNGEGWVPLKYHGLRSDMAARYLHKLMAEEGLPINFSMSSSDYLNSLCPGTPNNSYKSNGLPERLLLTSPLKERFKTWLVEGPPLHRFGALKYLAPDESVEEVLGILKELARLVQGLWVPKSSLLYGTNLGIEVLARDYVLLLFNKNVLIKNSELPQRPQLARAMKDVLSVLARERPICNDWKLKELPDMNFIKLNPSIVKEQDEEWRKLEQKINDLPAFKTSSKSVTINNPTTSKSSNKVDTRTKNVVTSRTGVSEDAREAIVKALHKVFKILKVGSYQQICQGLRDMAVSESGRSTQRSTVFAKEAVAAAECISNNPDELQAIIGQVALNIHGIYVPKSSPDHPQYDPFRKVVIDLFIAEGPNAKLKRAPIIEAAKMELKREIPLIEYQKVLQELCISQGSAWILRSGDGNPKL